MRAFRVSRPGLVSIPVASLPNAPSPETIHVWRRGVEVPVQVAGGALQFVAQPNRSPYSTEAVYWVGADTTPGLRTTLPAALTADLSWERDTIYQPVVASGRGDRWFAGELHADAAPLSIALTLPGPVQAGSEIQLQLTPLVRRQGHRIYALANGTLVGTAYWNDEAAAGAQTRPLTIITSLPAGPLQLELALTSVGAPEDVVFLDRVELPGVRAPLPMLPEPALEPIAAHDLRTGPAPGQAGASFLIISHSAFGAALGPLIAAHQRRGDTVGVVDAQAIYDQFSYGERDPEAIRQFIRAALASWRPAPRAVLLVGAGSARMRVEAGASDPTFIPPYLIDIDPKYGEVACDSCFARTTANVRDQLVPSIPVGRLPVHTLAEAHALVAKTVSSLSAPPWGSWRGRLLAVSDNNYERDGAPDAAGAFTALAERAIALLPALKPSRFYYAPNRATAGPFYAEPGALRRDLFASWDAGAALVLYVGHASSWQWAFTSAEAASPYLVSLYDADTRTNGARLPILLSMDCLSGNWANPTLQPLDERLLLKDGGGVAAALTPVGSGVNTGHAQLLAGALPALAAGQSLGRAHLAGLAALQQSGRNADLLFTYGVLGDPDIALPPASFPLYLPAVRR